MSGVVACVLKEGANECDDDTLITLEEYFSKFDNVVGRIIAGHRYRVNITQKQLAKKLGVSVRRISEWENGHREVSDEDADRISEAIGMHRN